MSENGRNWKRIGIGVLIGVVALAPVVVKITRNYVARKIKKQDVAPILSYDEKIQAEMEKED